MFVQPMAYPHSLAATVLTLASWKDVLNQVWEFLKQPHTIANGNITFSVNSLVVGAIIFAVAIILSRTVSDLLRRRIAKRAYLDPGIQYTLGRLTQYLFITIGLLLALTVGFAINLTSIAVI